MRTTGWRGLIAAVLLGGGLTGALVTAVTPAAASVGSGRTGTTLYVAPTTTTKGEPQACITAKFHTIPAALAAAVAGDTVRVCAGTYSAKTVIQTGQKQQPTITTAAEVPSGVALAGMRGAIINAKGLDNGVTFFAAGSASVSGFKVTGALGEGILAVAAQKITIKHNVVVHNDNGSASSGWFECSPQGQVPGDCGEGIHLLSSHDSSIAGNRSMFNSGGILLTDEFGPNFDNTISGNLVEDNLYDCGVTVVSHNPAALSSKGVPQPTKGGTFDNTISGNMIISNGTLGEGAGIVFASAVAGGAAYNNKVTGNEIVGNGLSGVTIHQHAPLTDVSGNVITGNWIGTNNLTGDPGTGDSLTPGVLVDNGGTHKVIDVTVKKNTIAWNTYGIYDHSGGGLTQSGNIFLHVTVHVKK